MSAPRVSVLILSRRRVHRLRGCLQTILAQRFTDREVLVLANGCDETAQVVRDEFPAVRLVEEPENLGSAGGRERVARDARGEYFFFVDDDGEMRDPDTLGALVDCLDARPRVGLVSIALRDAETDEPAGWRLRSSTPDGACYHASFAGGACLSRAAAFRAAGGYASPFTGAGEEFDLAVRLYAAEYAVLHYPGRTFHHFVEKSETDWMRQVALGYAHLQTTIWALFPAPWHLFASAKALLTALYVDVRLYGGRLVLFDLREGLRGMRLGWRNRRAVSPEALARLYAAKYFHVDSWDELERARGGVLPRLLLLRVRRKWGRVAKLPPPR